MSQNTFTPQDSLPSPSGQGPPEPSHLLIPAELPPAGEGRIHDVISHQEKGLELQEAGLGDGGGPSGIPTGPPSAPALTSSMHQPTAKAHRRLSGSCCPGAASSRKAASTVSPRLHFPPGTLYSSTCGQPGAGSPERAAPAPPPLPSPGSRGLPHLLQPGHGVAHLWMPQAVLRQVADDLREEAHELLPLGRGPPHPAAAHGDRDRGPDRPPAPRRR